MGKLANIRHDVRIFWYQWWVQFKAAAALRAAFVLQIGGMVFNNVGLLVGWWFMFDRFGTINGWSGADFIGMQGVLMLIFSLVFIFNIGLSELPHYIDNGSFDGFLTKPVGLVPHVASSHVEVAVLGDALLGVVLVGWYMAFAGVSLAAALLFLAALIVGVVVLWSVALTVYTLAFYMYDAYTVSRNFIGSFIDIGIYPTGVVGGWARTFLLTVVPGLFIGAVPLNILRGVDWYLLPVGAIVAIAWLFLSLRLFRRALRRYESSNLISSR